MSSTIEPAGRPASVDLRYTVRAIDQMQAILGGIVKLAGAELGVESFGIQVLDFPAAFAHYPEHDHAEDGQEEVYVVLHGRGDFTIDGETVTVEPGQMLRVPPRVRRTLQPPSDPVRILAIGSSVDRPYVRPDDFRGS
jgi:mannose-6-phosphate isomerase-like protein (cupin superfamily)